MIRILDEENNEGGDDEDAIVVVVVVVDADSGEEDENGDVDDVIVSISVMKALSFNDSPTLVVRCSACCRNAWQRAAAPALGNSKQSSSSFTCSCRGGWRCDGDDVVPWVVAVVVMVVVRYPYCCKTTRANWRT